MLDHEKEHILGNQLGKIGAKSGAIGALIGGGALSSVASAYGGFAGARWASKRLPLVDYSDTIIIHQAISDIIKKSFNMLSSIGDIFKPETEFENPSLFAVVGSGTANMNPTIVCLEFVSTDENSTTVNIVATAKEGLIKQKSAKKAVNRIKDQLSEL